jgi:ribonuclease P/MRP protein subunit POP1
MRRKPKRLLAEILSKPGCAKWLETHLWHAKRMKMVERWNLKLALHPNQKGVRFAYRSSASLSIIHDKSYMKVLEVRSTEEHLAMCFNKIADPTFPSVTASQYLNGRNQGSTILHEPLEYPFKCVAEVLFLWKPDLNGKQRTIWLWINSDQYSLVFQLIVFVFQSMNCKLLQKFIYDRDFDLKRMDVGNTVIKPLYQDLVRIEFTGPRSHAILSTCLTLDGTDSVAHRVRIRFK